MSSEPVKTESPEGKKGGMKLVVMIGVILGIVVLQAGIVFAAIKFFAPSTPEKDKHATEKSSHDGESDEEATDEHAQKDGHGDDEETGDQVYKEIKTVVPTEDFIISPKENNGRYVLFSLGIEVDSEEAKKEVEEKLMIPIRDRVYKVAANYSLAQLESFEARDSMRAVIRKEIKPFFHEIKLLNIYFNKYIVQ